MDNVQEIRRLLDERGADYDEYSRSRSHAFEIDYCDACGDYLSEIEIFGACIYATKKYLTPEQAIAATLSGGGCEMEKLERWDGSQPSFRCKECGHENYEDDIPNYCPRCGKAVKR